jgi:hypothetical protein
MVTKSTSIHGDLINTAAKAYLQPIGMKRKGKSRVWLKDNGWWLAVVEFQPSSWSKGTYLNVAATWLWLEKDYLSFNEYKRFDGFLDFVEPESFALGADKYASLAATEVLSICSRFSELNSVVRHLCAKEPGNPWDYYHAMMALLANGDLRAAQEQQEALSKVEDHAPWCVELKIKAAAIIDSARDDAAARAIVTNEIKAARALLKLPLFDESAIWQSV